MSVLSKKVPTTPRMFLVGRQAIVRDGLRLLVERRIGATVVGEASGYDGSGAPGIPRADLILLDTDLADPGDFETISRLVADGDGAKLLILTGSEDQHAHCRVMRLGAMGLVVKEHPTDILVKAIEKVCSGEAWFDRSTTARMLTGMSGGAQDRAAASIATLTDREREVVALVGEGLKNKHIAERLFISEVTVRHHVTSIVSKLGVSDRLELLIFAYRHRLAKPPI